MRQTSTNTGHGIIPYCPPTEQDLVQHILHNLCLIQNQILHVMESTWAIMSQIPISHILVLVPNLCLLLLYTYHEHTISIGNNRKIEKLYIAFIVAIVNL